jgi:hypothetical protein
VDYFDVLSQYLPGYNEGNHGKSQDNMPSRQDLNLVSPKYEA